MDNLADISKWVLYLEMNVDLATYLARLDWR